MLTCSWCCGCWVFLPAVALTVALAAAAAVTAVATDVTASLLATADLTTSVRSLPADYALTTTHVDSSYVAASVTAVTDSARRPRHSLDCLPLARSPTVLLSWWTLAR